MLSSATLFSTSCTFLQNTANFELADESVSRILCAASRSLTCVSGDWRSWHRVLNGAGTKPTQRDDHSSRSRIAPGLKQPTRGSERRALANAMHTGRASPPLLFGLAPRGVFRAPSVATRAVGSYPTFSPLPNALEPMKASPRFCRGPAAGCESHRRYIFCGTFRGRDFAFRLRGTRDATPWRYQARCLIAAGSCEVAAMGVRTFLPLVRVRLATDLG